MTVMMMILMKRDPKHNLIQRRKENLRLLALMNITLKPMIMNVREKLLNIQNIIKVYLIFYFCFSWQYVLSH